MKSDDENLIANKSKAFALRSIKLYEHLQTKPEKAITRQLLKSSTSIGANVKEALRGQSDADFGAKMNIALKEACETEYWLELLDESGILEHKIAVSFLSECRELIRILTAIVKSTFNKGKH